MATYYVATTGNNAGAGTIGDPWRDIDHAAGQVSHPGDIVYVRAGNYNELVTIEDKNGSSGKEIVFQPYQDEAVIVQAVRIKECTYIKWDGFVHDGDTLATAESAFVKVRDSDYCTISNCTIKNGSNNYGIWVLGVDGTPTGMLIDSCTIHSLDAPPNSDNHGIYFAKHHDSTVQNCEIYDCEGDCIQFGSPGVDAGDTYILSNLMYVTDTDAWSCENAIDIKVGSSTGTLLVKGNVMYGFRTTDTSRGGSGGGNGTALVLDNGCEGVTVDGNYFYSVVRGISWGAARHANIVIQNNVFHAIQQYGASYPSWAIGGSSGANLTGAGFYHNTIIDTTCWLAGASVTLTGTSFRNNLLYEAGVAHNEGSLATVDHNGWFSTTDTVSGPGDVSGSNPGLEDYTWEVAGTQFTAPIRLPADSALIDAGLSAPGLVDDFRGAGNRDASPDIGALQYCAAETGAAPGSQALASYNVAVRRDFVAQHFLVGGDWGSENEWHSHHYYVELQLEGTALDKHGYLVDIVDIETHLETLVDYYRDKTLNDLPEFEGLNPSIEHFARILCHALLGRIHAPNLSAVTVKIWENEIAWAAYRQEY